MDSIEVPFVTIQGDVEYLSGCFFDGSVWLCSGHIHDPSPTIRLQIFDHFVLRLFELHAHYFLRNSVVHA